MKTHGHCVGRISSPTYKVWENMKSRCSDENRADYSRYGGRGIKVFSAWAESFEVFLRDVGERPSILYQLDRINNELGYEPGNVRWATAKEQQRNRRNNRILTINGENKTLSEWAEISGVSVSAMHSRLKAGWDVSNVILPTNSRVVSTKQKARSHMNNVWITIGETSMVMTDWAEIRGIKKSTIHARIKRGWSPERAVLTPV